MIFLILFSMFSEIALAQGAGNGTGIKVGMVNCPDILDGGAPTLNPDFNPRVTITKDSVQIRLPIFDLKPNTETPSAEGFHGTLPQINFRDVPKSLDVDLSQSQSPLDRIQAIIRTIPKVDGVKVVPSTNDPYIDVQTKEKPEIVFDILKEARLLCR